MTDGQKPSALPLSDVTVLAVEQYGAGPFGSMLLADLGADVIKIENPSEGGDVGRKVGPFYFSEGDSHFHQAFNRNKRSITLNLKHPEGRKIFHRLVARADAVFDNMRGDQPARLGVDYASLKEVNPRIVCAHLSAYGREGERRAWPGYDYLMQAEAGYLSLTGDPDGPPARCGLSIVDMMTGLMAAFALVSAVNGARRDGVGGDIETSLFDTALHNLSYLAVWYLNAGFCQGREHRSAHPSLVPSQLCRTKDGWIFVMCNKEKFWPLLAERLGHPEWATDPRFKSFSARFENRYVVSKMLDEALSSRTTAEWLAHLGGEIPVAPVNNVASALDNPFVRKEERVGYYTREEGGPPVGMVASPLRVPGTEMPQRAAPRLGAHTEPVLSELGYDPDDLRRLRAAGAI